MNPLKMNRNWTGIQRRFFGLVLMLCMALPSQAQCLARSLGGVLEKTEIGRDQLVNSAKLHEMVLRYFDNSISIDLYGLGETSLPPAWTLPEDAPVPTVPRE